MKTFEFTRPADPATAIAAATQARTAQQGADVRFVAGGTTLLDLMKLNVEIPGRVLDINRLPLDKIESTSDGGLKIGATVRNSDLAHHARVLQDYPVLSQAILNIFAVLGLAPLTGVPLPFVSYGSSSLIVMLAAMGLLLNVAAGATGHVRAVAPARARAGDARARESARWGRERSAEEDRDRRRGDRRARGAGARGGASAAG